jgi:hypothetical protein
MRTIKSSINLELRLMYLISRRWRKGGDIAAYIVNVLL